MTPESINLVEMNGQRRLQAEKSRHRLGIGQALESQSDDLTEARDAARRVLELAPSVPTAVWGRDELGTGEMWNSNSIVAWLIARSGVAAESISPPAGGRAPGWHAGLVVARRGEPPASGL